MMNELIQIVCVTDVTSYINYQSNLRIFSKLLWLESYVVQHCLEKAAINIFDN